MPLTQTERNAIFSKLKSSLRKQCPPMVCSKDTRDTYEIIGNVEVPYGSSKKLVPGMYFASIVARKDMVSFYFLPMYYAQKEYDDIAPALLKRLKGKTCFNFRKEEQVVEKELNALLKRGTKVWKKLRYVK